jgi:Phosphoinositide phospholipase C, Ca2+-dependent
LTAVSKRSIAVVTVLVALFGAACTHFRPAAVSLGDFHVSVGPPGPGGARIVDVTARDGGPGSVTVRLDRSSGPSLAAGALPLRFTLAGEQAGPGVHRIVATGRAAGRPRLGVAFFSNDLRLNQLQVVGSHNSYHIAPSVEPFSLIPHWQYTHSPLDVQFESEGVRQIELDVFVDPTGHRVFHIPDVDFDTTCPRWIECLQVVKAWSDAHPRHLPIAILTELKQDGVAGFPTVPLQWDAAALDQLDAEIRSVFGDRDVLTPDDVRGPHATLAEAITTSGWPFIDAIRGQVLFLMDNGGAIRDRYAAGRPSLEGRIIFTNSDVGRPDAAFIKLNNPIGDATRIHDAVSAGYVVRTRADGDTFEARENNTVPRDAAIASGAQWVSTDYPVPGRAFGTPYFVSIPGGTPARCNPLNAPAWCTSGLIESLGG